MKKTSVLIIYLTLIALLITGITCKGQAPGNWKPNVKYIASKQDSAKAKKYVNVCWGTTKKGERCKRKVEFIRGFCWQHVEQK